MFYFTITLVNTALCVVIITGSHRVACGGVPSFLFVQCLVSSFHELLGQAILLYEKLGNEVCLGKIQNVMKNKGNHFFAT